MKEGEILNLLARFRKEGLLRDTTHMSIGLSLRLVIQAAYFVLIARSLGPDVTLGDVRHLWVYLVGPAAGAVIAVGIAWLLRGRGGDTGGRAAERGTGG